MSPSNQKGRNSVIVVGGAALVLYFAWHSQVPCSWGATEGTWRWSRGSFADLRWTFFVHLRRGHRSGCDLARLTIYWGLPHVWFLLTTPFPNRFSRHVSQFHVSQHHWCTSSIHEFSRWDCCGALPTVPQHRLLEIPCFLNYNFSVWIAGVSSVLGQTQNEKIDYTTCHWCWQVVPVAEMAYRVTNSASWDLAGPLVEKSLVIDQAWRNPQTLSQPGIKKEQHAQTIMINHEVWDSPFQGFKVVHYIHVFMYWKYCWPVHWSTITWKICIDLGRCCLGAQWKPCNCLLVDV